jgi:hypothetical protein
MVDGRSTTLNLTESIRDNLDKALANIVFSRLCISGHFARMYNSSACVNARNFLRSSSFNFNHHVISTYIHPSNICGEKL